MKEIKAILVDDEPSSLRSLKYELEKYCTNVRVLETYQDPVVALEGIQSLEPDLVFLDIEMPVLNGFDLLQKFSTINFDVIFVTAYDEFAIKAFEFNAVDYLLKPVLKSKLIQSVERVVNRQQHQFAPSDLKALIQNIHPQSSPRLQNTLAIPTSEGFEFIQVDTILRLEAESNYTWLYLGTNEKYLISKTLKEVMSMIDRAPFFRAHKSHVVNLNFVKKYVRGRGGYLVMKDQTHVPVSRNQKTELMHILEK